MTCRRVAHAAPHRYTPASPDVPTRRPDDDDELPPPRLAAVRAVVRGAVPRVDADPLGAVGHPARRVLREPHADQLLPRPRARRDDEFAPPAARPMVFAADGAGDRLRPGLPVLRDARGRARGAVLR